MSNQSSKSVRKCTDGNENLFYMKTTHSITLQ